MACEIRTLDGQMKLGEAATRPLASRYVREILDTPSNTMDGVSIYERGEKVGVLLNINATWKWCGNGRV